MKGKSIVLVIILLSIVGVGLAWFFLKDIEPSVDMQEDNSALYEIENDVYYIGSL